MTATELIARLFQESIGLQQRALPLLAPAIAQAAQLVFSRIIEGGKVLSCGNGGCAASAQYLSALLLHRFERERPGLPALALTTDGVCLTALSNETQGEHIFSRQVAALGQPGDVLVLISPDGNDANLLQAALEAREKELLLVILSGNDGGELARQLTGNDIEIRAPASSAARAREIHLLAIHCLCDLIDRHLLGD